MQTSCGSYFPLNTIVKIKSKKTLKQSFLSEYSLKLYVNATLSGQTNDIPPVDLVGTEKGVDFS
jgi:hypothetical protein